MLSMVIDSISSFMYSKLLVIMLIGTGVYFTIRTKFPQVRLFRSACKAVMEKPDDEDAVSSFQALMVSTASRVGTGNIVGVSSAICIGGFGAVFWMWVIAIIGSASAFVESTLAQITKDIYRIRTVTDDKGEDGKTVTSIYAEAAFYDLAYSEKKSEQTYEAETAEKPMAYALQGTGWSVGKITVSTKRSWQSMDKNALSMLRTIQSIYGGDLEFDNVNKQVSLLTQSGSNSGAVFAYRKNMKSIQRVVDTRSLVTRLYAYGADGMTFASINNGKEYVENTEYSTEIRVSTLDCSSFTNPYQMLEYTEMRLADYSKPSISYVIQVMDLSVLTGWEHESFGIGDVVTVDDKDLGIRISTRIIRMDYNVQEPWKTVIELSTKLKELGDSSASWEKAADTLSSSDLLDRQEMKDLVVNNHLLNSRADDGFSYWQNSGFEVDGENGASGNASFKCVGALNTTKTLSQEVYPATRSSYTVSASIATENLKKGANGRVGIELIIEYEDGSEETRFVELY